MIRSVGFCSIVFVPALSGCGSFINLNNKTAYRPYGGTMMDVGVISLFPTALGFKTAEPGDEFGGQGPEMVYLACMGLLPSSQLTPG